MIFSGGTELCSSDLLRTQKRAENTMDLKAPVGDLQQVSRISSFPKNWRAAVCRTVHTPSSRTVSHHLVPERNGQHKAIQGHLETVAINICSATAQDIRHNSSTAELMMICSSIVAECRRNWLQEHAGHTVGSRGSSLRHASRNASYYDFAS